MSIVRRLAWTVVLAGLAWPAAGRYARGYAPGRMPARRAFPVTSAGIAVFADQLPSNMTEAQYRFAATHYVGTQKMLRRDAAHLRRYNPRLLILHYRLAIGESDATVQIVDGNRWVSDFAAVNRHEDWFYHVGGTVGSTVRGRREFLPQWHWYLMNLASPGWRAYWLKQVRAEIADNGDDGVFADSCSVPNYFGGAAWQPPLPDYAPRFEAWWSAQIDSFLTYARRHLNGAALIPNAGVWVTTRDTTDYSRADGVMVEGFDGWSAQQPLAIGDWQLQMNRILALERKHKIVIAQNYLDSPTDVAVRLFYLGAYLLVKGDHTYINYFAHGEPEWYPEWSIPIGAPLRALPATIGVLYSASAGLYERAYTNGLTVVNPGTATGTLALGHTYYLVTPVGGGAVPADGSASRWHVTYTPVTRVTVAPHNAAILIRTPPPGA